LTLAGTSNVSVMPAVEIAGSNVDALLMYPIPTPGNEGDAQQSQRRNTALRPAKVQAADLSSATTYLSGISSDGQFGWSVPLCTGWCLYPDIIPDFSGNIFLRWEDDTEYGNIANDTHLLRKFNPAAGLREDIYTFATELDPGCYIAGTPSVHLLQ
jgi:hypothetical protein